MEIKNAVVHRLIKERNAKGASVVEASAELARNDAFERLLKSVLETYNQRCSRHVGRFEVDVENYRFSVTLREHVDGDTTFLEFTSKAMERLRLKIADVNFAIGGYVLFVRYEHSGRDMLLVAKLSQEDGAIFSNSLDQVLDASYLNLERLQVAARVDIGDWTASRERYLTFVMKQEQGHPSVFFKEFIGCAIEQDARIESQKLVKVVKDFANHMAEQGAIGADLVPDVQRRAFDYADELRRLPEPGVVDFEALSNAVWHDDPQVFLDFLNSHNEKPSAGFQPDRTSFRKLAAISFTSKPLTVKMTYDFRRDHVSVNGRQVVINEAPDKLLSELAE